MKQFRYPKTFGYARVSTTGQNLARQLVALHEAGIPDADIFTDQKREGLRPSRLEEASTEAAPR